MNEYSVLSSLRSQEGDYMWPRINHLRVRGQLWERVGPEDRPQAPCRQVEQLPVSWRLTDNSFLHLGWQAPRAGWALIDEVGRPGFREVMKDDLGHACQTRGRRATCLVYLTCWLRVRRACPRGLGWVHLRVQLLEGQPLLRGCSFASCCTQARLC